MRRREFALYIGPALASLAFGRFAASAQQKQKVPRVGVLWHAANADEEGIFLKTLHSAFRDLGYLEGQNIEIEERFPAEQPDRFAKLAQELVETKPEVIVASTALAGKELQRRTSTIPIVFVIVADPVTVGFVDGLARPGRNMTGLSLMAIDLSGKRLELLRDAVGKLSRVGLIVDRIDPLSDRFIKSSQAAANELGILAQWSEAPTPDDIEKAFSTFVGDGIDGVIIGPGSKIFIQRTHLVAASLKHKLPTMAPLAEFVSDGIMMSYGQDFLEFYRLAAGYVDKILKGAKPADLPVQQPTRFKLAINLKVANMLGVTVPPTMLSLADQVIE
jgi:putative tryptophan/tyrosine transport system substrate-binding protein